jgi:branched-chain amino acid transport system substrate-binding protein
VANADFLRVGGKDVEGTFLPAGPVLVADQLPASHPVKKSALAYIAAYEAANGKGTVSTFGAHAWDTGVLMAAAVPVALKKAKPGTPEFRAAIRDAMETMGRTIFSHGVMNWTAADHWGYTLETGVMLKVVDGKFKVE